MDNWSMRIWTEKVWKPYFSQFDQSALLLDSFVYDNLPAVVGSVKEVVAKMEIVPRNLFAFYNRAMLVLWYQLILASKIITVIEQL